MSRNIRRARETYASRLDLRLVQLDAQDLPFREDAFDVVLAMAMIYYLDLDAFLRECLRVLRSHGMVIFCTSNRDAPDFRPSRLSTTYYSVPELAAVFRHYGFDIELFGGFPTRRGRARLAQRMIALGGTALELLPLSQQAKELIRRTMSRFIGYERFHLDGEFSEEDLAKAASHPLERLPTDRATAEHRVVYGVARRVRQ